MKNVYVVCYSRFNQNKTLTSFSILKIFERKKDAEHEMETVGKMMKMESNGPGWGWGKKNLDGGNEGVYINERQLN